MKHTDIEEPSASSPTNLLRFGDRGWRFQIGGTITALFLVIALAGPFLTPHDPEYADTTYAILEGTSPSFKHWLGTDDIGRDLLSQYVYGARIALLSSVLAVFCAGMLSIPIGLLLGKVVAQVINPRWQNIGSGGFLASIPGWSLIPLCWVIRILWIYFFFFELLLPLAIKIMLIRPLGRFSDIFAVSLLVAPAFISMAVKQYLHSLRSDKVSQARATTLLASLLMTVPLALFWQIFLEFTTTRAFAPGWGRILHTLSMTISDGSGAQLVLLALSILVWILGLYLLSTSIPQETSSPNNII